MKEDIAKAKIEYELEYEKFKEKAEECEYAYKKHACKGSVYDFLIKREFSSSGENLHIAEALWVLALKRLLVIFNPLGILGPTEVSYAPYGVSPSRDNHVETREIPKVGPVEEYLLTHLNPIEKIIFERAFNQHKESLCMTALLSLLSHMDFPVAVSREYTEYETKTGDETERVKREKRLVFAKNPHFKTDVMLNENAHDLGSLYALFAFESLETKKILEIMEDSDSQGGIPVYAASLIDPTVASMDPAEFMTRPIPLLSKRPTAGIKIASLQDQEQVEKSTSPQDKYSPKVIKKYLDQHVIQDKYSHKAIKKYLDQHVIGQEKAKTLMSLVFRDHYKRINGQSNLPKANVLCIGPSGSGKTLTIEKSTEYLDLAYCIFNAASLTPAGYEGASVSEIFFNLYTNANCDIEKAQKGVVALDEIDKLGQGDGDSLQFRQSVQSELLKMVEKGEISFEYGAGPKKETISLKTDHILFVALGHFEKLWRNNAKVQQTHSIGFVSDKPLLDPELRPAPKSSPQFSSEDLIECGMKREFLRRFSARVIFNPVDIDMLLELFERRVVFFQEEFRQDGSDLEFSLDAKRFLIENTLKEGTGMSALDQKLYEILANLRFNIENYKGSKCVISLETLKTEEVEVIPLGNRY
ncbi:AAA family ATPase [Helicobacter suis]|uniref:AAA family ATPase n=1 Tax=Helicobacter suis TaxID=104628 RepID=UPI001F079225|nr:AAA family ATPase [Helicobacter suis]